MKAFDVIRPIQLSQKAQNEIPKDEYYQIQQKQQLRIPIKKQVQIDSISHQLKKPKVHLIKPKQPAIHIIGSKKASVLGLDTQNQEWTSGTAHQRQQNHLRGPWNIFGRLNRNSIEQHQQEISNQNNTGNQFWNPFTALKDHFHQSSHHNNQPIIPQTTVFPSNLQPIQVSRPPQQIETSQNYSNNLFQINRNNQQQKSESMNYLQDEHLAPQSMVYSQVRRVELKDLPQASQDHQEEEIQPHDVSIVQKVSNIFSMLKNRISKTFQQEEESQIKVEIPQSSQISMKNSDLYKNKNAAESEVLDYHPPNHLEYTLQRKIQIEQSIVLPYVQNKQ